MKSVGEILREAREKAGVDFSEVEKATKIRKHFLEALEKNDFGKIAEATIVRGFIKNYGEYLGLSSRDLLAIFRRDFIEDKKGQILPRGVYEPLYQPKFSWTPKLTIAFSIGSLFLILVFYLSFQLFRLLGAPRLEVYSPSNGESFKVNEAEVWGKTGSDAVVTINGEMVLVLEDGSFKKNVRFLTGENKILIEAISRRGKKTKIEKTVYFSP